MSKNRRLNPLAKWLALDWDKPERSYNPDLRDFLAGLLDYPKKQVVTEDKSGGGYPDIKLLTPDAIAWVVGDLKKDDVLLTTEAGRIQLWHEKRKYIEGLTRYLLFLTPHYLWIVWPTGEPVAGFEVPLDLAKATFEALKEQLKFISGEQAEHSNQWETFIEGKLPYIYLKLDSPETLNRLKQDLLHSFAQLNQAGEKAMDKIQKEYADYQQEEQNIERNLAGAGDTQRRALLRLRSKFDFHRHLLEDILPRFEDQYGREVSAKGKQVKARIREAFVADSVAVLIARVLFLRLVEDLQLTKKRRLSNGGPGDWAAFVEHLTGDARILVKLVGTDLGKLYQEPFQSNVFDWIYGTNGMLDKPLQRLILRLNAYDFSGLSEEILGDIYQAFLPTAKRKRLGEFYTPVSIVDWLLDNTVFSHEEGKLLDPACGSGSFLVRYVHRCLSDAKDRGLAPEEVCDSLQINVWGFDLNPFAAFISHFQLMWAMVRQLKVAKPPKIHVYNLNSLLRDDYLMGILGKGYLPPGSEERDREQWQYILGNPPYIRAERVKYGSEMKGLWQQVWGQNADTGLVFLYRAITSFLADGGFLGMVVSGGYANSKAAAKVWKLLYPRREAALRKLVWLEFTDKPVWNVNVIPMLLVIEKTPAQEEDEIELYVPSSWGSEEIPTKVTYGDFFAASVSLKVTHPSNPREGMWGDYLLPLLHSEDVPILRKLYPNGSGSNIVELKEVVAQQLSRNNRPFWWTYGIQRGGVEVTPEPIGTQPIQVIAGRSVAVGYHGDPAGWVDLDAVRARPNGKLSLWGGEEVPNRFIAVAKIVQLPTAAVVDNNYSIAALDSVLVALQKPGGPALEAIASYFNSKVIRFLASVRFRSTVLQGSASQHHPRILESLPWTRIELPDLEERLVDSYHNLAELGKTAKNNPDEWLLSEVETRIQRSRYILRERHLGLNFTHWTPEDVEVEALSWEGNLLKAGVFSFELGDADLGELVYKLLTLNAENNASISRGTIQKLLIPQDYTALMQEYRKRRSNFQEVEADFMATLAEIDETIYEMFGLTEEERATIEKRLSSFPLNQLQPRYPWQTVKPRPIKTYTEDRFA